MKFSIRYLSLFLCFVLLFAIFSVPVSATEVDLPPYLIQYYASITDDIDWYDVEGITTYSGNGTKEYKEIEADFEGQYEQYYRFVYNIVVRGFNGAILCKGGSPTKIQIENIYYSVLAMVDSTKGYEYFRNPTVKSLVTYKDNTTEYIDVVARIGSRSSFEFDFTPSKDIVSIKLICEQSFYLTDCHYLKFFFGEFYGDVSNNISINIQSEEAGLLTGVLNWTKQTFNKVNEGFSNVATKIGDSFSNLFSKIEEKTNEVKDKVTEVTDNIKSLPQKIWEKISEGLKSLFVPTESQISTFKNDMDLLLSSKMGALYQVGSILSNGWDRISANNVSNTIEFPQVSIPLPSDNEFTFGGQSVQIVPEGFDTLVNGIKLVVGISCTGMFVNGLRKRYDSIMEG